MNEILETIYDIGIYLGCAYCVGLGSYMVIKRKELFNPNKYYIENKKIKDSFHKKK